MTDEPFDATPDSADATPTPEAAPPSREAELEAEIARLKDQMLRALAEVENTRRRTEREMDDTRKFAIGTFARDLLPVADNLRRALDSVATEARRDNDALKALLTGVEATERQLLSALERGGVKPIEALGKPFDPNLHQVMFEVDSPDHAPGTILQVLQIGYALHERLLRPALVGTAKAPEVSSTQTDA